MIVNLFQANLDNITRRTKVTNIQSHLQILSASRNKNVKTYTVKHSEIVHNSKKSKINSKKNKYNNFTEVFVDDVKFEIDNLKLSIEKGLEKTSTDVEHLTDPKDDQLSIDDGGLDNSDINFDNSNDSIPLINNGNDVGNDFNCVVNDATETSHIEELTSHDIDKTNIDIERTSHDIERTNTVTERTGYDEERITSVIKSTMNVNPDKNLDNKFQRSVKKKFLDENHWNKITLSDEEAMRRFQSKASEQKYLTADFKCTDCYRTFSQEDMMKRHIKLRHCEVSLSDTFVRDC